MANHFFTQLYNEAEALTCHPSIVADDVLARQSRIIWLCLSDEKACRYNAEVFYSFARNCLQWIDEKISSLNLNDNQEGVQLFKDFVLRWVAFHF